MLRFIGENTETPTSAPWPEYVFTFLGKTWNVTANLELKMFYVWSWEDEGWTIVCDGEYWYYTDMTDTDPSSPCFSITKDQHDMSKLLLDQYLMLFAAG